LPNKNDFFFLKKNISIRQKRSLIHTLNFIKNYVKNYRNVLKFKEEYAPASLFKTRLKKPENGLK